MILEMESHGEGKQIARKRLPPGETSYLFTNLKAATTYVIGIIAFVDHAPVQVYKLQVQTPRGESQLWSAKPTIRKSGLGKFVVYWETPEQFKNQDLRYFVVEYRMPNQSE